MVHHRDGPWDHHQEYWKVDRTWHYEKPQKLRERLKSKSFHHKSAANKIRLTTLLCRTERGLLSYNQCTVQELRSFCAQRRLSLLNGEKRKDDLVALLEQADEDATFIHFLDLPAELRNSIYTMHFESLEPVSRPCHPPLTLVSHQLYEESMLLFYQTWTIRITKLVDQAHWWLDTSVPWDVPQLMTRAPKHCLQNLRRFEITVESHNDYRSNTPTARWIVDLGLENEGVQVDRVAGGEWAEFMHKYEDLDASIREGFTQLGSRAEGKHLQKKDYQMFAGIFAFGN